MPPASGILSCTLYTQISCISKVCLHRLASSVHAQQALAQIRAECVLSLHRYKDLRGQSSDRALTPLPLHANTS